MQALVISLWMSAGTRSIWRILNPVSPSVMSTLQPFECPFPLYLQVLHLDFLPSLGLHICHFNTAKHSQLSFIKHVLCARCGARPFPRVVSFDASNSLVKRVLVGWSHSLLLVNRRAQTCICWNPRASWLHSLHLNHTKLLGCAGSLTEAAKSTLTWVPQGLSHLTYSTTWQGPFQFPEGQAVGTPSPPKKQREWGGRAKLPTLEIRESGF